MKKKTRISLAIKLSLIFTAIVVVIIAGVAVANQILLGKAYMRNKRKTLVEAYETINSVFEINEGVNSVELEKIYTTKNISVFVTDSEGRPVFSSAASFFNDNRSEENERRKGSRGAWELDFHRREWGRDPHWEENRPGKSAEDGLRAGEYVIDEISDSRLGTGFICLTAKLSNGYILYMQTPIAAIDEAAETANRLLIVIGAFAVILSLIIIFAVSRAITKPIRELTEIAADMSELKFTRRYTGERSDEIGDLGSSVNTLSSRLETAIAELRASNARLEKDIELKERVDEMRRDFIAGASHELKTPLALISGYAEGLRSDVASEREDRDYYCEVIADEAKRMDKIIKQLLAVTELEASEPCEKTELNLSELVKRTVKRSGILTEKSGVKIKLSCEEEIIVTGDGTVLEQAICNYITNAVHHVDEHGIIEASLKREGKRARFSVYNSGAQIPPEAAERIWESFWKLDKARTRSYGGSGLGLAIVKRSVELHGGECGFNNTPDGVEFFFVI